MRGRLLEAWGRRLHGCSARWGPHGCSARRVPGNGRLAGVLRYVADCERPPAARWLRGPASAAHARSGRQRGFADGRMRRARGFGKWRERRRKNSSARDWRETNRVRVRVHHFTTEQFILCGCRVPRRALIMQAPRLRAQRAVLLRINSPDVICNHDFGGRRFAALGAKYSASPAPRQDARNPLLLKQPSITNQRVRLPQPLPGARQRSEAPMRRALRPER